MKKWILFLITMLTFQFVQAEQEYRLEHKLVRRLAVFPIADANVSTNEDAWWQMREVLTKDQRFFVASRRFLINRGVFQPRKTLKPADVIILSKILDAEALITTNLEERTLHMNVYEGENGYLLWHGDIELHPAIPIKDQMVRVSTQLIQTFMASIPYQGFQVIDESIGRAVYEDEAGKYAQVYIGQNSSIQVGDIAQWVEIHGEVGQGLFTDSARVTIFAEGKVKSIKGERAVIQLAKLTDLQDLKENSLIRFPKEINRLKEQFSSGEKTSSLSSEYLSSELKGASEFNKDHSSTSSTLLWIANLAGFILLAF